MATLVKSIGYIGVILLLGGGVFMRFVAREWLDRPAGSAYSATPANLVTTTDRVGVRRVWWGVAIGALLVAITGPLQLLATIRDLLGFIDATFAWEYLGSTRHGWATIVRMGAIVLVLATTFDWLPRRAGGVLYVLSGILLLGTFSWTSHAVAVGGLLPLIADLAHFIAAVAWAGSVIYLAWLPRWRGDSATPGQLEVVERVSTIGLLSVVALLLTGIYTALLHIWQPDILVSSPYGRALILKNVLVAVILIIAAFNRWWFLPRLRGGVQMRTFGRMLRTESVLLVAVLLATGVLATSGLPHEPGVQPDVIENLRNFLPF